MKSKIYYIVFISNFIWLLMVLLNAIFRKCEIFPLIFPILFFAIYLVVAVLAYKFFVENSIHAKEQENLTICEKNIKKLANYCELYAIDNKKYPKSLDVLSPKHIITKIICPSSQCKYHYNASSSGFTIYCKGHHHKKMNVRENFPQFTFNIGFEKGKKAA